MNSFFTSIDEPVVLGAPLTMRGNDIALSVNTARSGRMRMPTLMAARNRPR